MPGLVPGIFVCRGVDAVIARSEATKQSIYPLCDALDCFAALAMTAAAVVHNNEHWNSARSLISLERFARACAQNSFIIFVDGMFTTFIARLFTNAFDASRKNSAIACVVHAGHAD
jgi:hypothetical protein